MTDRFDESKRALEGVPARDVWAEAEHRAADSTVVPLAPLATTPSRRRGRWLAAAAAVAVLVAGTVAVVADDDEAPVDAGSGTAGSNDPAAGVTTYQADGACKLGITGEPLPEPVTVSPAETFVADESGAQAVGTLVEGNLNDTQTFAVQVPGEAVIDLVGEHVEDVQIERGTAPLWFQMDGPVQLRWFTGSQEVCESFTVTVGGGSEDENRHAAVDLGERVLMSHELPGCCEEPSTPGADRLDSTEWQLERATVDGEPTQGDGSVFSFSDGRAAWNDGCNSRSADYHYADDTLTLGGVATTDVLCESNPTSDAINAVMTEGTVAVTFKGDFLELRNGVAVLTLRPAGRTVAVPGTPYGIWPMTAPEAILGYAPEVTGSARDIAVAFAERVLEWSDATVVDSEPSEDGSPGTVYLVTSQTAGGEVEVRVRAGDGEGRHVVYAVNTPDHLADPEAGLGLSVLGSIAQANVSPIPAGITATVRFIYGENSVEGPVGEDLELTWGDRVPGAVLILFRDASGNIVGAIGTALQAGDVAAS